MFSKAFSSSVVFSDPSTAHKANHSRLVLRLHGAQLVLQTFDFFSATEKLHGNSGNRNKLVKHVNVNVVNVQVLNVFIESHVNALLEMFV